jgi:transcriptional regulator with GAF, ATPase, and Fis domain
MHEERTLWYDKKCPFSFDEGLSALMLTTLTSVGYLVTLRRPGGGYGNVHQLEPGRRYTLGRAESNEIVLADDLCSRQHAEVYAVEGHWYVRDCHSLNGTRIGENRLQSEHRLEPGDEVSLGRSRLVFVHNLDELNQISSNGAVDPPHEAGLSIVKRMGQTRYDLGPVPTSSTATATSTMLGTDRLASSLSLLYRLALKMGEAGTQEQLVEIVLNDLLEALPADSAAVLTLTNRQEAKLTAFRSKERNRAYLPLPATFLQEVLSSKQAVLAEDHNRFKNNARGLASPFSSLLCAPVVIGEKVEHLLHFYCTNPLKTLSPEDLELAIAVSKHIAVVAQSLRRQAELREENQRLKAQVQSEVQLIGESPTMKAIESQITRVASTTATVLIRGESGSGKELVARSLHLSSPRRTGPLICLNCAALAESLLESELFGHEKGAFTGATERKIGKFEAAHNGTIFLDEIGEMPPTAQSKLLRILEGHPYERVGGSEPVRVNVRVVAATNRPLEDAVLGNQFRRDLYYRLQVVEILLPPLRERPGDIPLMADHFLRKFLQETGRKIKGFTQAALDKMIQYHWPGNVRELRNVIERAVALSNGPMLDSPDIWLSNLSGPLTQPEIKLDAFQPRSLEELEKKHIAETLRFTGWVKSQSAQLLGIERSTLDRKIKAYEIQRSS